MQVALKLKVRKELDGRLQHSVIKLKGSLVSLGYTEIIHIYDQDDQFHMHSFEIPDGRSQEVREFITAFINEADLGDTAVLI